MENANKDVVKRRILVLLKMFYELTDDDHQLTSDEIVDFLADHGVPANKKTLRGDIALMVEAGIDIVTVSSKPNRYFIGERHFEMPELKLLIDAVSSSRFITQKKSHELGKKLAALASEHQQGELRRHVYATNRVKSSNESIYYSMDTINNAITRRRKIAFLYTEYTADKKVTYKNDGEEYIVSPYALFWNEDFYYMVCWSDKHGDITVFRVDRMVRPRLLENRAVKRPEDFSLDRYSKQIFEMYSGETAAVELECKAYLMKYVIDRYGEKVDTRPVITTKKASDGDAFIAKVEVALSPNFYAWVFRFKGDMKILSPEAAVQEFREMLDSF